MKRIRGMKETDANNCLLCGSSNVGNENVGDVLVVKCNECDFQFIPDNLKYLGEGYFSNYYGRNRKEDNSLNNLRQKQYKIDAEFAAQFIHSGSSVLDVGCSSGDFLSTINSSGKRLKLVGIDIDESAIDEAQKLYSDIAVFEEKDLLDINRGKVFDVILFRGTLQYLGNKLHESMHYLDKLLNDNGKIVIFSLPSTDAFMYYLLREKWALFHPEMNLMFNEKSIKYLSGRYDYNIERLEYPYLGDVYTNLKKDYENIKRIMLGEYNNSVPFWGSLMRIVLSKDDQRG
jgi:SAM-dependent methyltransferase